MGDDKKDQKSFSYEKAKTSSWNSRFSLLRLVSKLVLTFAIIFSIQFVFYPFNIISSNTPPRSLIKMAVSPVGSGSVSGSKSDRKPEETKLKHVVFGIAASSKLWKHRRDYVKLWWKPNGEMKGFVWLDKPINENDSTSLPPIKISSNTARFKYEYPKGNRAAIRLTRIVSETVRLLNGTESEKNVRWIVMGDDDTVFFTENLIRVLRKYYHKQFYYIGSVSRFKIRD